MEQSEFFPIVIIFIFYLVMIILALSVFDMTNVYGATIAYIFITFFLILLLITLYFGIDARQFPTIETKKLNAEEIINVALIHNILTLKGLKPEHLEKNKKEFINLCITHKFSLDDEKISLIFDKINDLSIQTAD